MKFISEIKRRIYRRLIRHDLFLLLQEFNKIHNGDMTDAEIRDLVDFHFPPEGEKPKAPRPKQYTVIMMFPAQVIPDLIKNKPSTTMAGLVKVIYVTEKTEAEAVAEAQRIMAEVYSSKEGGPVWSPSDFQAVTVLKSVCRIADISAHQVILP